MTPIKEAVKQAGGQTALADKLTAITPSEPVSQQSVYKWVKKGYPPPNRCIAIEMITQIHRTNLRPDVFLPPVRFISDHSATTAAESSAE